MAFLDAELRPGIEIIIEIVKLEQAIKDADLEYGIITLISVTGTPMRLDESLPNKVSLIKNSIKQSMMAIKTGKELKKN